MKKINTKIYQSMTPTPHTHTHTQKVTKIIGLCGLQDGRQSKCSNSAKVWSRNLWYNTKCVSGRLDQTNCETHYRGEEVQINYKVLKIFDLRCHLYLFCNLSISLNIFQYLSISLNISQYLLISLNISPYFSVFLNIS